MTGADIPALAEVRNRVRSRHVLDTETTAQIAARLRRFGYSEGTAWNMAEVAKGVARSLRESRMVGTERGE